MEIKSENQDGIVIVYPEGRIDLSTVHALSSYFAKRYERQGVKVVLDLGLVNFVSTSAINYIIGIKNRLEKETPTSQKGLLVLSNLKAEIVRSYFASDEFAECFTTFPTTDDAIAHLLSQS